MMSTFPFGLTVTLTTLGEPTGRDEYGKNTYTPTDTDVPGCGFAPATSIENQAQGQDAVLTPATLYMPTGTDVSAIDSITVPGYGMFEVDGEPEVWPAHPMTGWQPARNVVVRLRKVAA